MKKEIIIRETKIDWLNMIKLAFERKDWGKTFTLYTCGDVTINCFMREFKFADAEATFEIEATYKYKNTGGNKITWAYYHLKNFTIAEFKGIVNRKIISLLNEIKAFELKYEAKQKYYDKLYGRDDLNESFISQWGFSEAYEKINEMGVSDCMQGRLLDVLYEDVLEKANEEFEDLVENYCETKNIKLPNVTKLLNRLRGGTENETRQS